MTHHEPTTLETAIDQADWLGIESGYDSVDSLYADDPELFTVLATEWREQHQDGGCYI